jgi:hypothetical protein
MCGFPAIFFIGIVTFFSDINLWFEARLGSFKIDFDYFFGPIKELPSLDLKRSLLGESFNENLNWVVDEDDWKKYFEILKRLLKF